MRIIHVQKRLRKKLLNVGRVEDWDGEKLDESYESSMHNFSSFPSFAVIEQIFMGGKLGRAKEQNVEWVRITQKLELAWELLEVLRAGN